MTNPTWTKRERPTFTVAQAENLSGATLLPWTATAFRFTTIEATTVRAIFSSCDTETGTFAPIFTDTGTRLSVTLDPTLALQEVNLPNASDLVGRRYVKIQLTTAAFVAVAQATQAVTITAICKDL